VKDELRNIISGKSKVRDGAVIQATTRYLKRSAETSQVAKEEKHYKKKETTVLKEFVTKNNLWLTNINIADYVSEGAEQKVYLKDDKHVLKLNDAIYYNSWEDYLNNLLLHNFFFPDTAYELTGFIKEVNEDKETLYAVVKQPFVKATTQTDLQAVKDFLNNNGFLNTKNHDYYHPTLGIILEDLHDENVLTKDGMLLFIDTVFYIKEAFYKD
jgi:serine/threonin/tyrosin kinase-like protein